MGKPNSEELIDEMHLKIIQRGAVSTVRLAPLERSVAITTRFQLYRLRRRLISMAHPAAQAARLITIKLMPVKENDRLHWELIVHPKTLGLEEAYLNAELLDPSMEPPPLD